MSDKLKEIDTLDEIRTDIEMIDNNLFDVKMFYGERKIAGSLMPIHDMEEGSVFRIVQFKGMNTRTDSGEVKRLKEELSEAVECLGFYKRPMEKLKDYINQETAWYRHSPHKVKQLLCNLKDALEWHEVEFLSKHKDRL